MSDWSKYSNEDLGNTLSDYHKDVHGYRPRFEGLYDNREAMIGMLEDLDAYMARMHSTPEGRAELREMGFVTSEPELDEAHRIAMEAEEAADRLEWENQMRDAAELDELRSMPTLFELEEERFWRECA